MIKNFTLLAMGALLTSGLCYAAPGAQVSKAQTLKSKVVDAQRNHEVKNAKSHVATRALPTTDIITNPSGTTEVYYKNATGFDYYGYFDTEDMSAVLVFGENNDVYFQDFINGWGLDSYVKGEINGNEITMSLPQTVADYGWYAINLSVLESVGGDDYELVSDIDSVTFSYDPETGTIELQLPGDTDQYMLGYVYTDDSTWTYSGELTQEYRPFDGVITSLPEGLETEVYMLNDGYYGHPVNVGIDAENIYLQGLNLNMPEAVVVAALDGDMAHISQDQNIGAIWGYFIYTKVLEPVNGTYALTDSDVTYDLNVDLENKVISNANDDYVLCLNASLEDIMYLEIYDSLTLAVQDSYAGTPVNPTELLTDNSYADYGISIFAFNIPNLGTEGQVLDNDNLYYRVYVDGDVYEFEYDESDELYPDVEGVMTEVPFNFDNGWDLYWGSEVQRVVYFYFDGASSYGVQSVYNYDGVETCSDIVTLDLETGEVSTEPGDAGVDSLISSDVVSEIYYDLSGRKVNNPSNGLFIRKSTLSNGQTVTKKVIRR